MKVAGKYKLVGALSLGKLMKTLSENVWRDCVKSEKSGTCLKNSISSYFVQRYLIVSQ